MANYVLSITVDGKDNASGPLGRVSSAMGNMGQIAGGILTAGTLYAIGSGIISIGKSAFAAVAGIQRMELAMESLVARELKNTDITLTMGQALEQAAPRAEELLKWIQKLAIESPFDMAGVQAAFQTAMAYGFTSEQAQGLTQNMIDLAAGTGRGVDSMSRVALALGQIHAKGKLAGQEVMQLTENGVDVTKILEDMGFTLGDVEKGLVKADAFMAAFSARIEDDFEGAALRATESWEGLFNALMDIKNIGLDILFADLLDVFNPFVVQFTEWMQTVGYEKLAEMGKGLADFGQSFVDLAVDVKNGDVKIGDILLNISENFKNWSKGIDWAGMSDDLIKGIEKIDWPGMGVKIENFASDIFSGIGVAVTKIKWGEIAASLTIGLSEALASAVTGNQVTFESSLAGYQQFGDGVRSSIADWQAKTEEGLFEWSVNTRTSLAKFQSETSTNIFNALSGAIPSISAAIDLWNAPITIDLEKIKKLFFNHFLGMGIQAILGLDNIQPSLLKKLGGFFVSVMEAIRPISISIGVELPNFAAILQEIYEFVNAANAAMGGLKGGKTKSPGGNSSGGGGGGSSGGPVVGASRGLDNFIVPPGYPNDSFPIMVQSGERVQVSQPGTYRNSGKGGDTFITNVSIAIDKIANELDIRKLAYQVADEIRIRR